MKINLFEFDRLEKQITSLREKLKIPKNVEAELAVDSVHGLNDLTRALALLYPHKRSIAVLGSQPPPLNDIVKGFAGEGFVIQELPVSFAGGDNSKFDAAWSAIKSDTLFVLGSAVEPLTGAIYPIKDVAARAAEKRIFSLFYLSPDALARFGIMMPENPYEGVVLDPLWDQEVSTSLVLKGERVHGQNLLWGDSQYSPKSIEALTKSLKTRPKSFENEKLVRKIESLVVKTLGSEIVFTLPDTQARLFDRGVFFINGVNGDALSHALAKKRLTTFTGAACNWNNPQLNSWLPGLGLDVEKVQSSLVVPLSTLGQKKFLSALKLEVIRLRKISGSQSN